MTTGGMKRAVEIAMEQRPPEALTVDEQLDLLGLPDTKALRKAMVPHERRLGRPQGAVNKRTEDTVKLLLSQYTHPLVVLARIYSTPVEVLAKRLSCTKLEAQQEIRLAAIAVKDHVASKMPVAVDLTNHKVINLVIHEGDADIQVAGADDADGDLVLEGTLLPPADGEGGDGGK